MSTVDLQIEGMTCASCAAHVEKSLNQLDGVTATVNFATEQARVEHSGSVSTERLVEAVEAAGYGAKPVGDATGPEPDVDPTRPWRDRTLISAVLTVPVLLMSMIPALQFDNWQWLALTLASPVVVWGSLPFHQAAWTNLRHRTTTMDTLISMGVLAAFGWSLYTLFIGDAGIPGMKMPFELTLQRQDGSMQIYLEVAAALTVFILAGRFEARAKRRSGAALRALLELGAKDVAVVRGDGEVRIPIEQLAVGDRFVVRPAAKRWPPTASSRMAPRPSMHPCSPARACRSRWPPATPSPAPP